MISAGLLINKQGNASPVPKNIQKAVSYPVYYPDPKKLPAGYNLDPNSFSAPKPDVIVYSLRNKSRQKLSISVQAKPDDSVIQDLYNRAIPLRSQYQTKIGLAQIGVYQSSTPQTIASLPTNDNVWIIITGPVNINQTELKQVLSSLKK